MHVHLACMCTAVRCVCVAVHDVLVPAGVCAEAVTALIPRTNPLVWLCSGACVPVPYCCPWLIMFEHVWICTVTVLLSAGHSMSPCYSSKPALSQTSTAWRPPQLPLLPAAGASMAGAGLLMASSKKPSGKWPSMGPWPNCINTPRSPPLYCDR